MTADPVRLTLKHRKDGLLVDTNLALLLLVGIVNQRRIPQFNRTRQYTVEDFRFLVAIVSRFEKLVTTPHVLTELSNLGVLHGEEHLRFRAALAAHAASAAEYCPPSRDVVSDTAFTRLGMADAAITMIAAQGPLVLTDDRDLYYELVRRQVDAIHFGSVNPRTWPRAQ